MTTLLSNKCRRVTIHPLDSIRFRARGREMGGKVVSEWLLPTIKKCSKIGRNCGRFRSTYRCPKTWEENFDGWWSGEVVGWTTDTGWTNGIKVSKWIYLDLNGVNLNDLTDMMPILRCRCSNPQMPTSSQLHVRHVPGKLWARSGMQGVCCQSWSRRQRGVNSLHVNITCT